MATAIVAPAAPAAPPNKVVATLTSRKFWAALVATAGYFFAHVGVWTGPDVQALFTPLLIWLVAEAGIDIARVIAQALPKQIEPLIDPLINLLLPKLEAILADLVAKALSKMPQPTELLPGPVAVPQVLLGAASAGGIAVHETSEKITFTLPDGRVVVAPK